MLWSKNVFLVKVKSHAVPLQLACRSKLPSAKAKSPSCVSYCNGASCSQALYHTRILRLQKPVQPAARAPICLCWEEYLVGLGWLFSIQTQFLHKIKNHALHWKPEKSHQPRMKTKIYQVRGCSSWLLVIAQKPHHALSLLTSFYLNLLNSIKLLQNLMKLLPNHIMVW